MMIKIVLHFAYENIVGELLVFVANINDMFAFPLLQNDLTFLGPMTVSIKLHIIKSRWTIVYNEGS